MIQTLWIPGPVWAQNEMIAAAKKARGRVYAAKKREWTNLVKLLAKATGLRPVARAHVTFDFRELARRRDPDNLRSSSKWILDGLVAAGVLPDDGWDEIAGFSDTWRVDKAKPGVLVTITAA